MKEHFRQICINHFTYFYLNSNIVYYHHDKEEFNEVTFKKNTIDCIKQYNITVPIYFLELVSNFSIV